MMLRRAARVGEVVLDLPACTVIASLPDGRPLVLADSAETIWDCLPGPEAAPIDVGALVARVAGAAGAEAAAIAGDVRAFAAELVSEGVAVTVPADEGGAAERAGA